MRRPPIPIKGYYRAYMVKTSVIPVGITGKALLRAAPPLPVRSWGNHAVAVLPYRRRPLTDMTRSRLGAGRE